MLQQYVTKHTHPAILQQVIQTTAAPTVTQNMVAWVTPGAAKAVSLEDANYFFNSQQTLAAGTTGYYIAERINRVQGYPDMFSLLTGSFDINGFPAFAQVMPFYTSADLSAGPQIPLSSVVWVPIEYNSIPTTTVAGNTSAHHNGMFAIPVPNDPTIALWGGLAIWGGFAAGAVQVNGAMSLRHVRSEYSVFIPNK